MKKVILTLTGMLMWGLACVNAQTDGTQPTPEHPTMQSPQESSQYRSEDRVRIPASQVPTALRQTLKSGKYAGWETSGVYLNRSTNEYSLDLMDGSTLKTYRFDQNGKEVASPTKADIAPSQDAHPTHDGSAPPDTVMAK